MKHATKKNDDCTGEFVYSLARPKRKKSSNLRTDAVYSIPKRFCSQMFLEAMVYVMSEGLKTTKKRQPVKKRLNAADQFRQAYQAEYEARERAREEGITRVDSHNAAYPKLQVSLDEKRSTAKPLAIRDSRSNFNEKMYDPKCELCVKMRNEAEAEMKDNKKTPSSHRIHHRRHTKSRVTKTKTTGRRPNNPRNAEKESKGCSLNRLDGNDNIPINITDSKTHVLFVSSKDSQSVGSKTNPDSTQPSVSSFNSVLSIDHEPMVSPK